VTTTEIFDLLLFILILGGVIWLGYRTMRLRPPDGERGTGADFSWMCRPTSLAVDVFFASITPEQIEELGRLGDSIE
jgi:hypothetical protein